MTGLENASKVAGLKDAELDVTAFDFFCLVFSVIRKQKGYNIEIRLGLHNNALSIDIIVGDLK